MSTAGRLDDPPGWHGRPIEELPWAVVIRVAVCWGVVCMILTLLAAAFLPRPFGFIGTTVVSGSMMPNIQPGDVALVQPLDEYGLGQVILFPSSSDPDVQIMHRIVEIQPDGMLVTKGDANRVRDSAPVDPETVIGVGRILVPAIGLPIVWAVNGEFLLVVLTVLLTALLVRGTLRIEFFPSTRKRDGVRAIIESTAVVAMLGVAAFVIVVGVARSATADFVDRTSTEGSWAMTTTPPAPTGTCTITKWTYNTWFDSRLGPQGLLDFKIKNNTDVRIPGSWTLEWTFQADERAYDSDFTASVDQPAGSTSVTLVAEGWLYIEADGTVPVEKIQIGVTSASNTYLEPKDLLLNDAPCDFAPATAEQLVTVIPSPAPTAQ